MQFYNGVHWFISPFGFTVFVSLVLLPYYFYLLSVVFLFCLSVRYAIKQTRSLLEVTIVGL